MKGIILSLFLVLAGLPLLGQTPEEFSEGGLPPVLKACDEKGNRDGKIQRQELPERLLRFFDSTDLDGDGVLTWQEVDEAKAKRFADLPKLEDVLGNLPPETLDLLGGKLYDTGWVDVSFVIDALVRVRAASLRIPGGGGEDALSMPPDFKGIPDVDHIRHIGHSFGAFTAHAVGGANFSPTMGIRNFRDPRVDAIVPISPQGFHRFGSYDEGPSNRDWGEIRDAANLPDGVQLQGVRAIEPSPFPDERGKVFYFGGYAADYAYIRNTAWIYKGTLKPDTAVSK